jgi:adenine deaminase
MNARLLPVKNGAVEAVPEQDIMKAFVFERHKGTGLHGCGFVKGFGITVRRHGADGVS